MPGKERCEPELSSGGPGSGARASEAKVAPRLTLMTRDDYDLVMKGHDQVGIADLKAHLSEHLRRVRGGESLVLLDRQTPVARLVPYAASERTLPFRPAQGALRQVRLPKPVKGTDSLAVLLADRNSGR